MSVGLSKETTAVLKKEAPFMDDISDGEHYPNMTDNLHA